MLPKVTTQLAWFIQRQRAYFARPQYIYGPLTNKRDYLDWFFDRAVHGLECVPLPLHGDQLVALTHAEDVASMLASVVGNENAVNQVRAEAPRVWVLPHLVRIVEGGELRLRTIVAFLVCYERSTSLAGPSFVNIFG